MYNKLFNKILDSSVWLEPQPTRIVWLTFIACMDEDSFVALPSVENVAHRARVSIEEAREAIQCLESPDKYDINQEFQGRRIERLDRGWLVLKGQHYRSLATAEIRRAQNAERQRRFRERNATVTQRDEIVTPSETETETTTEAEARSSFSQDLADQRDQAETGESQERLAAQALVDLWNATTTPPIPRCRELSANRIRRAKARMRDARLPEWEIVMRRIEASPFCRGDNANGWTASFDWMLQPDTRLKVMDGRYDPRKRLRGGKPQETHEEQIARIEAGGGRFS